MNKTTLLVIGGLLILVGLIKPNFNMPIDKPSNNIVVVDSPSSDELKELCQPVIDALRDGGSSRVKDGKRLSDLYMDLATLVELDGENMVVKTTEEIKQANSLAGVMLRMDIKNKYPNLASSAQALIAKNVSDDMVLLDETLRAKAVESFRALAWATNEGTK
jgi:hypothetical protein